ncbi:hypothetical protein CNMCM5793_002822 [Aspergillus hiratsukae]|uniref:BZIP domain-containing protein n=1 Tax=Aspergillus hiratsukae TaxID=1194566 RepID=A0A8H6PD68_9EURO|nr:hypothetical protein CNMCM5793_002822 [Aspergillus hiratsukae]
MDILLISSLTVTIVTLYTLLVRYYRFQRCSAIQSRFTNRPPSSMTVNEAHQIIRELRELEFPHTLHNAMKLSLLKTDAIPTMTNLFLATGQLSHTNMPKRAADTEVLLNAPAMILDEDMLHTLGSAVVDILRTVDTTEWRVLSAVERCAIGVFHKALGDAMEIPFELLPSGKTDWTDGGHFARELFHRGYRTGRLMDLGVWNLPGVLKPVVERVVAAKLDGHMRASMGFTEPGVCVTALLKAVVTIRRFILRYLCLPRREARAVRVLADEPDPVTGLYTINLWIAQPWYVKPTFSNRWGVKALFSWGFGDGAVPSEKGLYREQGYDLRTIGPAAQEKRGLEGTESIYANLKERDYAGMCPFAFFGKINSVLNLVNLFKTGYAMNNQQLQLQILSARSYLTSPASPDERFTSSNHDDSNVADTMNTRSRTRSAGRPRLDANSQAHLSEDRRNQVRRAQRTYRLKKEAAFRSTKARVQELEERMRRVSESLNELYQVAEGSELHVSHPAVFSLVKRVHSMMSEGAGAAASSSPRGHSIADAELESSDTSSQPAFRQRETQPSTHCHFPFHAPSPNTIHHTHSHQETRFARRLQRYSLEHAYRLFTDPCSQPREIYRVFRLVPCIQDKEKTQPYFERLLQGGCHEPLELPALPFYCIGGAGTHYPDLDGHGKKVYPLNMRMPGRVLGILPEGSEAGPTGGEGLGLLEICGFGGQWFDSRDVEGYLRDQGVDVDDACLFPVCCHHRLSGNSSGKRYIVDMERFFSSLLQGLVILGRAPGFRKAYVKAAFKASLRLTSST